MREPLPARGPGANRTGDRLDLSLETGLEIEDPQRRVLVFGLRYRVATVGGWRERVTEWHARDAGDGGHEFRLVEPGYIVDVIAARSGAVHAVLVARRIISNVEIVVTRHRLGNQLSDPGSGIGGPEGAPGKRDLAYQSLVRVAADQHLDVIDVRERRDCGREQQCLATGMFIGEDLMEPARGGWRPDGAGDLELRGVRQPGHVKDDCTEIIVRSVAPKLERLGVVVTLADLKVGSPDCARSLVQFRVGNVP